MSEYRRNIRCFLLTPNFSEIFPLSFSKRGDVSSGEIQTLEFQKATLGLTFPLFRIERGGFRKRNSG